MESNKILAIISIIIGLIFIIFPMFSANLISILIGASVLLFGIGLAYTGIISKEISGAFSSISAVFGVVMIILGLAFIFGTNAISFLIGLQFYIVGFMLIVASVIGLLGGPTAQKTGSIISLVLGIVILFIAVFAANNPVLITIILGIALIAHGISAYLHADEY
ncbi:DUF308 domain-containing protein [Methanobrevibacter olleyae]|uniref:DUF308 domain-containing protein n=1 Tax=Methanobrevibacter olleyae TaxID=294671 RepID=A0A126R0Q9_METOL|nr:DUF308 domain-containing protein [Methanobrevibacter olleyae]AMK15953.1 hypothetical protein YLM1_1396 [Methanobrevibacter olleyae]SFL16184.1 Short repeat of unknown function [Methanobrevibacter olleyae]